jgi:hypothetical protein
MVKRGRNTTYEKATWRWKKRTPGISYDTWPSDFIETDACGFSVSIKPNGLNSSIIVTDTYGTIQSVLGWIGHYMVWDSHIKRNTITTQAYTPVTHIVADPTLVKEGKERLPRYIQSAISYIDNAGIRITFWKKDALLSSVVSEDLIHTLAIIEKMDPSVYTGKDPKRWEDMMKEQLPKIYWRLGANQSSAFISQVSPAQACGISQYTLWSWDKVYSRIPWLDIWTFDTGCRDHEKSIRAMFWHIEMELGEFDEFPEVSIWLHGEWRIYKSLILAMGYNSNAKNLSKNLSDILKSKKYTSPQDIIKALLTKLPRKLIDREDPKKWYQVSETLYYSLKFIYFMKSEMGLIDTSLDSAYIAVTGEIIKQLGK